MDNYRYIDLKTFEVLEDCPLYIHCDKDIADIIAILNKKGYKTKASCAGHNKLEYTIDEYSDDISNLEEIEISTINRITRIDEEKVYYKAEILGVSTYISFLEKYNFTSIPDGFVYDEKDNLLFKMLYYYLDDDCVTRKSDVDIENELKSNWKALREWALSLEELRIEDKENKINDKNE